MKIPNTGSYKEIIFSYNDLDFDLINSFLTHYQWHTSMCEKNLKTKYVISAWMWAVLVRYGCTVFLKIIAIETY